MKKKSKIIIVLVVVCVALILFYPSRSIYKDGGSVSYKSLTYEIVKYHAIYSEDNGEYKVGTGIFIFNNEVYSDTEIVSENNQ